MDLINEMNHVVEHCYDLETKLKELVAQVHNEQLQNHFTGFAQYYKSFGDHLFLVLASEGHKIEKLAVYPGGLRPHWIQEAEMKGAAGDAAILQLVIRANRKAKADLANAFSYSEISKDLAMVVRNGILEINSILEALQSNELLDS